MPSAIDHLVIAVPDPEAAAAELTDRLGLAFTAGGRHEGAGTFNRVAFAGDAYLELIGVSDQGLAQANAIGAATVRALDAGGGLATYALLDDDLPRTVEAMRAAGSSIGPVTPGSRARPDGTLVEWWTAMPPELGPGRPPFLIRHRYAGVEWGKAAMDARREFTHPLGSRVTLVRLDIATADPPALAAEYERTLGLELWSVADLAVCSIGPHTLRLVPIREMALPAVVVLGAQLDAPRTVDAFGVRFDLEPIAATS